MGEQAKAARDLAGARNLAMLNYALLFAAAFFAGVPALIAVIIAYVQRDGAPASLRRHHDFQIRIFWTGFILSVIAGACALGALLSLGGELIEVSRVSGWDHVEVDVSRLTLDGRVIALGLACAAFSLLTAVWLVAAPAVGFIRLASEPAMGESPAP
jgi:uncharacterized membrane protein